MSIEEPAIEPYTANWKLDCISNSMTDIGVWQVTIQASLVSYPKVPAITSVVQVNVQDPCLTTKIMPNKIEDMTVSVAETG